MAPPDPDFLTKLAGTWTCLSFSLISTTNPNDIVYPLGPDARGTIIYTPDGYMQSLFLRADLPKYTPMDAPSAEQQQAVGAGIYAYTAPFELGERLEGDVQVIYHRDVELAVPANWVGSTQVRHCRMREVDVEDGKKGLEMVLRSDGPLPADQGGVIRESVLRFVKRVDRMVAMHS